MKFPILKIFKKVITIPPLIEAIIKVIKEEEKKKNEKDVIDGWNISDCIEDYDLNCPEGYGKIKFVSQGSIAWCPLGKASSCIKCDIFIDHREYVM